MQVFENPPADHGLLNDSRGVRGGDTAVKDCLRIDGHGGAVFALLETTCLVCPDQRPQRSTVIESKPVSVLLEVPMLKLAGSSTARPGYGPVKPVTLLPLSSCNIAGSLNSVPLKMVSTAPSGPVE